MFGLHKRLWSLLLQFVAMLFAGAALAEPANQVFLPTGDDARTHDLAQASNGSASARKVLVPLEVSVEDGLARSVSPLSRMPPVSSRFGWRNDPLWGGARMHAGIDLPSEFGTPVRATMSGRVRTSGWAGGYGNLIEIEHGNGVSTRYGHLSRRLVNEGGSVPAGAIIGFVGSSGRSTGNHLHYEIRLGGRSVDPQSNLRFAPPAFKKTIILAFIPPELPPVADRVIWSNTNASSQLPVAILPTKNVEFLEFQN